MEAPTRLGRERMAPKVRLPKGKAAPLRRPSAVVRRRGGLGGESIRRPARRGGEKEDHTEADPLFEPRKPQWVSGDECRLLELDLKDVQAGQEVVLVDALYFGAPIKMAGRVVKLENEGSDWFLVLRATGTTSEALLRVYSRDPLTLFHCHLCSRECGQLETGDYLLHASRGRLVVDSSKEEAWVHNLERSGGGDPKDDELAALRRRAAEMAPLKPGAGHEDRIAEESEEKSKKAKKKVKKEKGKKEKERLSGKRPMSACQKELKEIFGGTGLDPKDKVRRKVLKKARKYLSKKGRSSSSGGSSSESDSKSKSDSTEDAMEEKEGLFSDGNRVRTVAEKYPGALCCEAVRHMRENLMAEEGDEVQASAPRAVAVKYFRQQLQRRASGPAGRDMLNVASALDLLLKGRVASAADLLAQRLKSSEASMAGTHWTVSQRMEVPQAENLTIAPKSEVHQAQKENYSESRVAYLASLPPGRRGEEKGGKGRGGKGDKGKWENPHKGDPKGAKGKDRGNQNANKGGAEKEK